MNAPFRTYALALADWQARGAERIDGRGRYPCGHQFADGVEFVSEATPAHHRSAVLMACTKCGRLFYGETETPVPPQPEARHA